jgi:hypothetical protein
MSSSNTFNLSSRTAALKSKTTEIVIKEVPNAPSAADTLTLFEHNSSPLYATSNEWTIDLFPNQVTPFMFILSLASSAAALCDFKSTAKVTVATIALYYMTLFNAFFLINDTDVRPSPSAHAASWKQNKAKNDFVEFLKTLPVPESMMPLFSQLFAAVTEHTPNVFVVPSAAGFEHDQFFGRFFPLNLFSHIHDCIATMPGNSSRIAIFNDLLPRVLYTIKVSQTVTKTLVFADFFGFNVTTATPTSGNAPTSKLMQMFSSVFNPVLFRDFHRRSSLASIDLQPVHFKKSFPNAYDIIFAATTPNLKELKVVLQSVLTVLNGTVPMKHSLAEVIANGTGIAAFQHGFSSYALPTWSFNDNVTNKVDAFSKITSLKSQSLLAFGTSISYLQRPDPAPTADTDAKDVTVSPSTATVTARKWPLTLRAKDDAAIAWPAWTDFESFTEDNEDDHEVPKVLVLDVLGTKTVAAFLATLSGKIVESFELDGTTIEIPNAFKPLGMQNSQFADSAIPFKYCLSGTAFYPQAPGSLPLPLKRALPRASNRLPASSLLHNRTAVYLPEIAPKIIESTVPSTIPGMTKTKVTAWLRYCQSFLGFRTVINDNSDDLDSVPEMEANRLYLWSPYTYTPYEDSEPDALIPDLSQSRSYFLSNLRTVFGTDMNLIQVTHPFEAMPTV